jgi:hypothetical protein
MASLSLREMEGDNVAAEWVALSVNTLREYSRPDSGLVDDDNVAAQVQWQLIAIGCGLELENVGSPEAMGDRFWYDDGELEWPEEAVRAREEEVSRVAVC